MLATTQTLLADLNISPGSEDAERAEDVLEGASTWVRKYLDRPIEYQEGFEEKVRGSGFPKISLSLFPVKNVQSIKVDGREIDSSEYEIEEPGFLYRERGWPPSRVSRSKFTHYATSGTSSKNIEITYDGGYVTPAQAASDGEFPSKDPDLPQDLREAVLFVASTFFQQAGQHGRVRRGHVLRTGTWFEEEEYRMQIEGLIGHYRDF